MLFRVVKPSALESNSSFRIRSFALYMTFTWRSGLCDICLERCGAVRLSPNVPREVSDDVLRLCVWLAVEACVSVSANVASRTASAFHMPFYAQQFVPRNFTTEIGGNLDLKMKMKMQNLYLLLLLLLGLDGTEGLRSVSAKIVKPLDDYLGTYASVSRNNLGPHP